MYIKMETTALLIVVLLIVVNQVQCQQCSSNKDCASDQCCGHSGHSLINVLAHDASSSRTCVALSGAGGQCPASGVFGIVEVCGCQTGLVCYIAPSGMRPMYGQCITQAQYATEQQRLKDNPWLMMLPGVNPVEECEPSDYTFTKFPRSRPSPGPVETNIC